MTGHAEAPEWDVVRWFNAGANDPPSVARLKGRVVVLHAFQMLCPGCVFHGLPQAARLHAALAGRAIVVGLHAVFEHHDAMTDTALAAFISEFRLNFPIAVDRPGDDGNPLPRTMRAYGLRGTPSLILIDRKGRIRHHGFGQEDDLDIGMRLGAVLSESP